MNESNLNTITSPARVLSINGGSSSIKFALFEAGPPLKWILEGGIERIGLLAATFRVKVVKPPMVVPVFGS